MSDSRLENIFANLLLVNALLEIPFKRKYIINFYVGIYLCSHRYVHRFICHFEYI